MKSFTAEQVVDVFFQKPDRITAESPAEARKKPGTLFTSLADIARAAFAPVDDRALQYAIDELKQAGLADKQVGGLLNGYSSILDEMVHQKMAMEAIKADGPGFAFVNNVDFDARYYLGIRVGEGSSNVPLLDDEFEAQLYKAFTVSLTNAVKQYPELLEIGQPNAKPSPGSDLEI